jgi:GNAT superfamily N-acetyltransferase
MKLAEITTDRQSLEACACLLQSAFPRAPHLNAEYLRWLYLDNPAGTVIGYNAWEDNKIIGHYATIPVEIWLDGEACMGLLALNTAMHPDYRSAGVIYSLANRTCKLAERQGYACIYAVANAASTPILVKTLKFQFVSQLMAAIGPTRLRPEWHKAMAGNRFRRRWTNVTARWRAANPSNPSRLLANDAGTVVFRAKTRLPRVFAHGIMPVEPPLPDCPGRPGLGLNLFLGLLPESSCHYPGYLQIPKKLKPSPLNFIFRPLGGIAPRELARNEVILGLHDFDPY